MFDETLRDCMRVVVIERMIYGELTYTSFMEVDAPPPPISAREISWWRGSSGAAPKDT
jgi:hypothetical protein